MKRALITGITGQDGSYLAELLLSKGYEVHGIIRRSSTFNTQRIDHIFDQLHLHYGDVTDSISLDNLIKNLLPDEIYNLSAQSHVAVSFEIPEYTGQVDGLGVLKLLEAVKKHCPKTKIYQASTSELFGKVREVPQTEITPFYPRSPYGVAKLYAYWICRNYRESYNLFISNGILFNHESERRGETFVTRKITKGLVNWYQTGKSIKLGTLDSKRDWGYAKEYVEVMWLMLQQDKPDDFVISTGECHSNREFVEEAFQYLNCGKLTWIGKGADEKAIDENGNVVIETDPKYLRPSEVELLIGNSEKAEKFLGWIPKVKFKELVKIMMEHDLGDIVKRHEENVAWDEWRDSLVKNNKG